MQQPAPYVVHGLTVSYFTRKVTGYLDHVGLPWRLQPSIGANPVAREAGWNGGIPVITAPDGELMWDSTAVIEHLDAHHGRSSGRQVLPDDPTMRFLAYLLDDFSDEWFYRHAVGTRWLYDENRVTGSWDIAREGSREIAAGIADVKAFVTGAMTDSLPRLGTTPDNIEAWVQESLVPWQQAYAAHLEIDPFLFGGRPSLADFAFFGGNAAHFINDPWCRRLTESVALPVVGATHKLMDPPAPDLGPWRTPDDLPDTLVALLAEAGRHYLPWVARATRDGSATVHFDDGSHADIATTNFLTEARGIMLARYAAARSPELDAILERAGIVRFYADHLDQATSIPDPLATPRPADNRPYRAGA
jgi:glutathione S-transferase